MLIGGFCAVMMNVLIRFAAYRLHPFEVTFFRCLFSLFVMLPFIIRAGPSLLATPKVGFYTLRAVVGLISMLSWFYGITIVPLATATAVNFTAPLFATMAAALILHEDVRLRRWAAVVIGFLGEVSDGWTWAGAAIIAGAAIYVAHREAKLARLGRAVPVARPAVR